MLFGGVIGLSILFMAGCSTFLTNNLDSSDTKKNIDLPDIDAFLKKINLDKIIATKSMNNLRGDSFPLDKIFSEEFQSCMSPMVNIEDNVLNAFKHPLEFAALRNKIDALKQNHGSNDSNSNSTNESERTSLFNLKEIPKHDILSEVEKKIKSSIPLQLQSFISNQDLLHYVLINYLDNYFSSEKSDISGFISRDGTRYKYTGVSADKNAISSINHSQMGADVMRIGLEAFRDVFLQLPVVPESTLYKLKYEFTDENGNRSNNENLKSLVVNIYEKNGKWAYKEHPYNYQVSQKKFNDFQTIANKVESEVATLVGTAIRGGSIEALNNEALAKIIETSAGVKARHLTERAFWCSEILPRS